MAFSLDAIALGLLLDGHLRFGHLTGATHQVREPGDLHAHTVQVTRGWSLHKKTNAFVVCMATEDTWLTDDKRLSHGRPTTPTAIRAGIVHEHLRGVCLPCTIALLAGVPLLINDLFFVLVQCTEHLLWSDDDSVHWTVVEALLGDAMAIEGVAVLVREHLPLFSIAQAFPATSTTDIATSAMRERQEDER